MYGAIGSGVFYPLSRTVVGRRSREIVQALCTASAHNMSIPPQHEGACERSGLSQRGNRTFAIELARDLGFDTLVFTESEEWSSPGYKVEIIGLNRPRVRPGSATTRLIEEQGVDSWSLPVDRDTHCPIGLSHLAWGWRAERRPCICDSAQLHVACMVTS